MELSKSFQVGVDYKDHKTEINWGTFQVAEAIFIDKTHPGNRPLLYQLDTPYIPFGTYKPGVIPFPQGSFTFLGEITHIDKKKKQISLANKNIVAYNHLVIVLGKKPVLSLQSEDMTAALQTLSDAMRVKNKIPSFPTYLKKHANKKGTIFASEDQAASPQNKKAIEKIVRPYIAASDNKPDAFSLQSHCERFYEVQI